MPHKSGMTNIYAAKKMKSLSRNLTEISSYHSSVRKRMVDLPVALFGLTVSTPFVLLLYISLKLTGQEPVFYFQERVGKNGKTFKLIKFRTMIKGAEKLQKKYRHLNVADGPVFKIPNDPRYTKFGRLLVKTGLDELPQLLNVIKGDMSLVGPRPFPKYEERYLSRQDKTRESVLPGITSEWVVRGGHRMKFEDWMKLDRAYVKEGNLASDILILIKTGLLIAKLTIRCISLLLTKFS